MQLPPKFHRGFRPAATRVDEHDHVPPHRCGLAVVLELILHDEVHGSILRRRGGGSGGNQDEGE